MILFLEPLLQEEQHISANILVTSISDNVAQDICGLWSQSMIKLARNKTEATAKLFYISLLLCMINVLRWLLTFYNVLQCLALLNFSLLLSCYLPAVAQVNTAFAANPTAQ